MSDEKIDLAEIAQDVRHMHDPEVLALVRAVRAARAYCAIDLLSADGDAYMDALETLQAALAAFTDSADSSESGK